MFGNESSISTVTEDVSELKNENMAFWGQIFQNYKVSFRFVLFFVASCPFTHPHFSSSKLNQRRHKKHKWFVPFAEGQCQKEISRL